jgi:hypothetical protein
MNKGTEGLTKILKEFQNMSQDQFDSIINSLYEKVSLDQLLFEEFLTELILKKEIDSEELLYFPEKFNIAERNLFLIIDYLNYLIKQDNLNLTYEEDNPFPHFNCKFKYKDILFNMRMISGQGTIYQFDIVENTDEVLEFNSITIDESIKFERLKRE